ncbi:MAG: SDR family NAD(P)-dependent oxidoreductase [Candidatus Hydrogenedentales bacterium]
MKDFENKVALVTGAGSPRGIGRAVVETLARMGSRIVASDVEEPLPDVIHEVLGYKHGAKQGLDDTVAAAQALGVEAIAIRADITVPEDVEQLVAQAEDAFGRIDSLVNVAGGSWGSNRVGEYEPEQWLDTIKVNLFGAFLTSRYVLPIFEKQRGGVIVNVASIAAERACEMVSAYSAAKAGLVALTRDIAVEYGPQGIRANAVLPGDIQTDLLAMEFKGMATMMGVAEDRIVEQAVAASPLRRLGIPADVAELVAFLCTDHASFLTGLAIPVTGGKELPWRTS